MIDINNLKVILKANGVSLDLSDDELLVFVDYKVHELEGLLGFNVEETERNESHFVRKGNNLLLNFYPIVEVSEVKVNNKVLDEDSYIVDSNIGVIYFNSNICLKGFVEVSYSSGLPYFIVKSIILFSLSESVGIFMSNFRSKISNSTSCKYKFINLASSNGRVLIILLISLIARAFSR